MVPGGVDRAARQQHERQRDTGDDETPATMHHVRFPPANGADRARWSRTYPGLSAARPSRLDRQPLPLRITGHSMLNREAGVGSSRPSEIERRKCLTFLQLPTLQSRSAISG